MAGFSWAGVPEELKRDLARELALENAGALAGTYGDVPGTDFVRAAWPVLVTQWLAGDDSARADVVAGLRAAGLGDHEAKPRGKDEQLAYLRSCRNTARLRQIVLDRFVEIGTGQSPHPVAEPASDPRLADPTGQDLRTKVESAWADLAKALADALPTLPLDAHLVLTLDPTAGGTGDATYYVEFALLDDGELHAEAVGNEYLPAAHRLDRSAIADLVALGWSPPGVVDGTEGNFGLRVPGADVDRLAAVAVRTMREVYGAPHPAFLTYTAHALEGDIAVPHLGAARHEPPGTGGNGRNVGADAPLAERVRAVVAGFTKTAPAELPVDEDGEISIRSGSAMVFVKVLDDPPLVDVYSPILTKVRATERLYERLSVLTRSIPVGRLYLTDDTVWASMAVFGRDFQPSHLTLAIQVMTGLADQLDDKLQGDFGGHVFFGDTLPERRETAAEDRETERTGMYL